MNFNRISNRVTNVVLSDPYVSLQMLRRSLKALSYLHHSQKPAVRLGSKNKSGIIEKVVGAYLVDMGSPMNDSFMATIGSNYSLAVCFDPVLFMGSLKSLQIPLMTVATAHELVMYPEIAKISDYIIPSTGNIDIFADFLKQDTP